MSSPAIYGMLSRALKSGLPGVSGHPNILLPIFPWNGDYHNAAIHKWRLYKLASLLLLPLLLSHCSSTSNTIAGLSTLQSTISGSNYVFFVDPASGRLVSQLESDVTGDNIEAGDYFAVTLDFGFLRYLQAVDPYVIVYSETWMGSKPRPSDSQKSLRQIVLIKEGMAPNARLPVTSIPLLGPVTMGDDSLSVYVTVKVVVLSKRDNQETIQLVEGIASSAAAAAPQYAPLAGAAAATMGAFIAQNKDKVEFEHTLVFTPGNPLVNGIQNSPHSSQATLREGQIAIIKGESRYRSIPYPNWYYYLWPFNWFGLAPDGASRRFEADETPKYTLVGELIRMPAYAVGGLFSDARSDSSLIGKLFFNYLNLDPIGTDPTRLGLDGYHLVRCIHPEEMVPASHSDDLKLAPKQGTSTQAGKSDSGIDKNKFTEQFIKMHRITQEEIALHQVCRLSALNRTPVAQPNNMYSEKTHIVLRVQKTRGTLGTFNELQNTFSAHAEFINEVATSSSEASRISRQKVAEAFDSIKKAVLYDRARQDIREDAQKGIVRNPDLSGVDDPRDRDNLLRISIEANVRNAETSILEYARVNATRPDLFTLMVQYIQYVRTSLWHTLQLGAPNYDLWLDGWRRVLIDSRKFLQKYEAFSNNFITYIWEDLLPGGCLGSREKPAISIGDVEVYKGPAGIKLVRLSVKVSPHSPGPLSVKYATIQGTAKPNEDFDEIKEENAKTLPLEEGDLVKPLHITIKSDGLTGAGKKAFFVKLILPDIDKAKADVCRNQGVVTIHEGDGNVSTLKVNPMGVKEDRSGRPTANVGIAISEPNPDPIRLKYKIIPGRAENLSSFESAQENDVTLEPYEKSRTFTVALSSLEDTSVSILFLPGNTNNVKSERGPITVFLKAKEVP